MTERQDPAETPSPQDAVEPVLNWRSRLVSAEQAVGHVHSGSQVFVGSACATPRTLIGALGGSVRGPRDLVLLHFLTHGAVPVFDGRSVTRFRHRVFYVGEDMRAIADSGRLEYVPASVSQLHGLIDVGRIPIDVAMIQVSPPDDSGRVSLGVSVGLERVAVGRARMVIAEINPNMPRTEGDTLIPLDRIQHLVEVDEPVIEYTYEPADEIGSKIARYVARIIDDGATLQVGLGRVANETLRYLTNRSDLGIHSAVITEAVADLIEAGVITGARKSIHRNQVVASYCMGSRRLYDLVDRNRAFSFQPIDYVCNPGAIGANHKLVSVTEAHAVDLTGQVCADRFEGRPAGGVSSQPEFLRGAAAAKDGKAIICLASTTEDGGSSRIKAQLGGDEGVTVARWEVHFVVTEYGIAYLYGHSLTERALALIGIAHPDFRDGLLAEAKRLGHVGPNQTLKSRIAYPAHEERQFTLKGGRQVLVRPTRASDVEAMRALFYAMNEEDIRTRFFTNLSSFSTSKAQHLCNVSYDEEMAFVAVTGSREHEEVVGNACYYVNPATRRADVAYMIRSDWKGLGLGTALQRRLIEYAMDRGLRGFTADVLYKNPAMLSVFEKSGFPVSKRASRGSYEIVMDFGEGAGDLDPAAPAATPTAAEPEGCGAPVERPDPAQSGSGADVREAQRPLAAGFFRALMARVRRLIFNKGRGKK